MRQPGQGLRRIMGWGLLLLTIAFCGCASPSEIKTASRAEIGLISALDDAVGALQTGLAQFHQTQAARIREEGRMLIAQQAIDVAFPLTQGNPTRVTADRLFEGQRTAVQPWIDYAFQAPDFDAQMERLQKRKAKAADPLLRAALEKQLQDLTVQKADATARKPQPVQDIEQIVLDDLAAEAKTAASVSDLLDILRAQIAVMKSMAEKVDAWLAIDVTVNQQQADALRTSLSTATKALHGRERP
ncbi:MAG TPA: hypothetical protein VN648_01545 [Candidatus Methylomirabilis sp.]|nr:hypothetical protein [Candidatus Methylomirabilis sp.]